MSNTPPHLRNVNTVFQDYALFPHMNVRDNVAYGLMVKGMGRAARHAKAEEMLALVHLEATATASRAAVGRPAATRGARAGDGQRTARPAAGRTAGRAGPEVARGRCRTKLKALQKRLGLTFVFVTHDQHEALSMADSLAVFNEGRIAQIGTPQDIYDRPAPASSPISSARPSPAARPDPRAGRPGAMGVAPPRGHPSGRHRAAHGTVTALRYVGSGTRRGG